MRACAKWCRLSQCLQIRTFRQALLNTHQLVVLGVAVRPARSTCLDLSAAKANSNVGYGGVLSLSRAMGAHDTPTILLAHLHSGNRLRESANLVYLQEQRIACLLLDGCFDALCVGDG